MKHVYLERDPCDFSRYVVRFFAGAKAWDSGFASLENAREFARKKARPNGKVLEHI